MKTLIILRGIDYRQQNLWIKDNNLEPFVTSWRDTAKQWSYPIYTGEDQIKLGGQEKDVDLRFYENLSYKMTKGNMIVVPGQFLKISSMKIIRELAYIHGYEVFIKNFPIPPDAISALRVDPDFKETKEPDDILRNIKDYLNSYNQDTLGSLGKRGKLHNISELYNISNFWFEDTDSKYRPLKVDFSNPLVFIGDIHGYTEKLMAYMSDIEKRVEMGTKFVFLGDYIDRGPDPRGAIEAILKWKMYYPDDVYLLEGNHELSLRRFLGSIEKGKENLSERLIGNLCEQFEDTSMAYFMDLSQDERGRLLGRLNRNLQSRLTIYRNGQVIHCTHGGFWDLEQLQPRMIGSTLYGNRDMDQIDKDFSRQYGKLISIHGHCKYPGNVWEPLKYPGVYNLGPEKDGDLVILEWEPGKSKPQLNVL